VITQEGDDFETALKRAFAGQFGEIFSEHAGGALSFIPVPKRLQAIKAGIIKWWLGAKPGRTVTSVINLLKKGGWHGPIAESFEERVANVYDYGRGERKSPLPTLRELAIEGIGFTAMAGAFHGIEKAQTHLQDVQNRFKNIQPSDLMLDELELSYQILAPAIAGGDESVRSTYDKVRKELVKRDINPDEIAPFEEKVDQQADELPDQDNRLVFEKEWDKAKANALAQEVPIESEAPPAAEPEFDTTGLDGLAAETEPAATPLKGIAVNEKGETTFAGETKEQITERRRFERDTAEILPMQVHNFASDKGLDPDSKKFGDMSENLTGERHLDKMSADQLRVVERVIDIEYSRRTELDALPKDAKTYIFTDAEGNQVTAELKIPKTGQATLAFRDANGNELESVKVPRTSKIDEALVTKEFGEPTNLRLAKDAINQKYDAEIQTKKTQAIEAELATLKQEKSKVAAEQEAKQAAEKAKAEARAAALPVEPSPEQKQALYPQYQKAFELPLITNPKHLNLDLELKFAHKTPTGKTIQRAQTVGERQKEITKQQTVLQRVLHCLHQ
jgi:hypothetical protein